MKKTIALSLGILALIMCMTQVSHAANVATIHFEYKSAAINSAAQTKLSELSLDLKHLKNVVVTAYVASDAGDPAENQSFATQRVDAVKNYLVQQGVDGSAIATQTLPGPASKSRMVEVSYGTGSAPSAPVASAPVSTPPPAAPKASPVVTTNQPAQIKELPPPPVSAPPPAEPTASTETSKKSTIQEVDVTGQPSGAQGQNPNRWEY